MSAPASWGHLTDQSNQSLHAEVAKLVKILIDRMNALFTYQQDGDEEAFRNFCEACRNLLDKYRTKFESETSIKSLEELCGSRSVDEIVEVMDQLDGFEQIYQILALVDDEPSEDALGML